MRQLLQPLLFMSISVKGRTQKKDKLGKVRENDKIETAEECENFSKGIEGIKES